MNVATIQQCKSGLSALAEVKKPFFLLLSFLMGCLRIVPRYTKTGLIYKTHDWIYEKIWLNERTRVICNTHDIRKILLIKETLK